LRLALAGVTAAFAATLGPLLLTGQTPGWIAARLPDGAGAAAALAMFLALAAAAVLLALLLGARRPRRPAG
jgi:hypothetical protein